MALLLFRDILGHPTANSWMSSCLLDGTFFLVGFVSFTGTATAIFCYAHSTTHYFLGLLIIFFFVSPGSFSSPRRWRRSVPLIKWPSLPVLITDVACQIQTAYWVLVCHLILFDDDTHTHIKENELVGSGLPQFDEADTPQMNSGWKPQPHCTGSLENWNLPQPLEIIRTWKGVGGDGSWRFESLKAYF